jgi:hypothetical protein
MLVDIWCYVQITKSYDNTMAMHSRIWLDYTKLNERLAIGQVLWIEVSGKWRTRQSKKLVTRESKGKQYHRPTIRIFARPIDTASSSRSVSYMCKGWHMI